MLYYSTNKKSKPVDFKTALLRGLASDGGLFMPTTWPKAVKVFEINRVLKVFTGIPKKDLEKICAAAFDFPVPLVRLDENLYILELFHGPTLSFKDFGARFMARAMNYYLAQSGRKLNIIVATSGDTGSAVANGFYGLPNIKVFVLYPSKRISPLQEKQIATLGGNVIALEVKGDFDDCQRLAKQVLGDSELRRKINLSSANSINVGRLLPQMQYYIAGYSQLKISHPVFIVPSGNFGNLTAGLFAKKMGLPLGKFIAAVNKNSVIPEYFTGERIRERKTSMTFSNAMDVGKPSNWARIVDLYGESPDSLNRHLKAVQISEKETKDTISGIYKKYNYIVDPHTAVGVAAAFKSRILGPKIVLATAHPAKFKEIVQSAIGRKITTPRQLLEVSKKSKKSISISKNYKDLRILISR